MGFSLGRGGQFEKLILGLDRARQALLGKQWVRVGKHRMANPFKKYSNPDLRYPTSVNTDIGDKYDVKTYWMISSLIF